MVDGLISAVCGNWQFFLFGIHFRIRFQSLLSSTTQPEIQASTIETKVFFCFLAVWEAKNENPTYISFDAFRFVALLMLLVKIKSMKEMSRGTKDFGKSKY